MVRGRRNERTVTAHMHSLSTRASAYSNFLPTLPRRFRIFSVRVNLNRVSTVGTWGGRTIYIRLRFFFSRLDLGPYRTKWFDNRLTVNLFYVPVRPRCCGGAIASVIDYMRPRRNDDGSTIANRLGNFSDSLRTRPRADCHRTAVCDTR